MSEVAKKKGTELSTDLMADMFAVAGQGAAFDVDELIVPNIKIAQQMSPELKKSDAKFIAGLSASDMFNSLTSEKYDGEKGISFIACHTDTTYVEFGPKEGGGGFVGILEKVTLVFHKRLGTDLLRFYLTAMNLLLMTTSMV